MVGQVNMMVRPAGYHKPLGQGPSFSAKIHVPKITSDPNKRKAAFTFLMEALLALAFTFAGNAGINRIAPGQANFDQAHQALVQVGEIMGAPNLTQADKVQAASPFYQQAMTQIAQGVSSQVNDPQLKAALMQAAGNSSEDAKILQQYASTVGNYNQDNIVIQNLDFYLPLNPLQGNDKQQYNQFLETYLKDHPSALNGQQTQELINALNQAYDNYQLKVGLSRDALLIFYAASAMLLEKAVKAMLE